MSPDGAFSHVTPMSPSYGAGSGAVHVSGGAEWEQHPAGSSSQGTNSRTSQACRRVVENPGSGATVVDVTPSTVVGELRYWPVQFLYDAAGNTRFDGRRFYQYDGANRLKEVWSVAWGTGGSTPMPWYRLARFDYDGLGRLLKARYDTNAGGGTEALADEETEWTPRDQLGRPIGIWRQPAPTTSVPSPRAVPYQLFAYHNTSLRGGGADDSRGILDCPAVRWRDFDGDGEFDAVCSGAERTNTGMR